MASVKNTQYKESRMRVRAHASQAVFEGYVAALDTSKCASQVDVLLERDMTEQWCHAVSEYLSDAKEQA